MSESVSGSIYDPNKDEPATPVAGSPAPIERDPQTGRFLKPGFSTALVREARTHGLTDEELAEMTVADVRAHVRDAKLDSRFERQSERLERLFTERPSQHAEPTPAEQAKLLDDEDGYDKGLVALLKRQQAEIDALKEQVKDYPEVRGHVQQQARTQAEAFNRAIEREFAKHPHIFGTGTIDKLDRDSPEFDFRMAAVKAHRKAGAVLDELSANVQAFVAERFQARPEPKEADAVSEWEQGVLGRPTQRGLVETPPGREKAIEGVRTILPKRNGRAERPDRGAYLNPKR